MSTEPELELDEQAEGGGRSLPAGIRVGDPVQCIGGSLTKSQTKPPSRFTDGSLIAAMESVHRFVTDPEVKKRLKETSGLGTEATRAGIIATLSVRDYISYKGKKIISTPKGRELIDVVPPSLADPGTTALWEDFLQRIAKGDETMDKFMGHLLSVLPRMVEHAKGIRFAGGREPSESDNERFADAPTAPCPEPGCGEMMVLRQSRKNPDFKFWACQNREHGLRRDENGAPGAVLEFTNSPAGKSKGRASGGSGKGPRGKKPSRRK